MNWSTSAYTLLLSLILVMPAQAVVGYLGASISEYDVLGCHNNSKNPRCKRVVKIACKSVCCGHEEDSSDLGDACRELCQVPESQVQDVKSESQTPESDGPLPLLTDLSFAAPEDK